MLKIVIIADVVEISEYLIENVLNILDLTGKFINA